MSISISLLNPTPQKHVSVDPAKVKADQSSVDQDVQALKDIWNQSGDQSAQFKSAYQKLQSDELSLVKDQNPNGPPQLPSGPFSPPHGLITDESMAEGRVYSDMQKVDGSASYYKTLCKVWNKDSALACKISDAEQQMDGAMSQGDLKTARQQQAILQKLEAQAAKELNLQPQAKAKPSWLSGVLNFFKHLF